MCALARLFTNRKEAEVRTYAMADEPPRLQKTLSDALDGAEAVILPLPASRDGVHPTAVAGQEVISPSSRTSASPALMLMDESFLSFSGSGTFLPEF